jgi:hypothetical protein
MDKQFAMHMNVNPYQDLIERITALESENARLKNALYPFVDNIASVWIRIFDYMGDDEWGIVEGGMRMGDLRNAARFFEDSP